MITNIIPFPLLKSFDKSRQDFLAAPKIKEKKGWFEKEKSEERREKRSKKKSEYEGRRKRARLEGSPSSLAPQKRTLVATEDALAQTSALMVATPLKGV